MRNTIIYCNSQKVGTASETQPSVLDIARALGYMTSTLLISCDYTGKPRVSSLRKNSLLPRPSLKAGEGLVTFLY